MSVRTLGWMPSATLVRMIARSGNMQTAPIAPVKVMLSRAVRVAPVAGWPCARGMGVGPL